MKMLFLFFAIALAALPLSTFNYAKTIDLEGTVNSFEEPVGLAYANGKLYVSDAKKDFIYVVDGDGNYVQKIGGPGHTDSNLDGPEHIYHDGQKLYMADRSNGIVKIYAGSSSFEKIGQGIYEMTEPKGIYAYGGKVYVIDAGSDRLFVYDKANRDYIGSLGMPGLRDGQFNNPSGIFIEDGLIYVADTMNSRISVYDLNLTPIRTIGRGEGGVQLNRPEDVYVTDLVYVVDTGNNRIVVFSKDGFPLETFDGYGPGNASFDSPKGLLVMESQLYVADTGNSRVLVFNMDKSSLGRGVVGAIESANRSVSEYLALAAIGNRLNATVSTTAPGLLLQASTFYAQGKLTDAQTIAAQAESDARSAKTELEQKIIVRGRSLLESARQKLALYENRSSDVEFRLKQTEVKNKIASGASKLDAKDYAGAADSIIASLASASELEKMYVSKSQQKIDDEQEQAKAGIEARLVEYEAQAKAVQARALELNASAQLGYAQSLIASARNALLAGNLLDANASLEFIGQEILKAQGKLNATGSEVGLALSAINATESEFRLIENGKILLGPNLQGARLMLAAAKEKAYSDPATAQEIAKQAGDAARQEGGNARLLSVAIIVLGAFMMAFFAALVVGIFLYFKGRRKKGI
jgi:DNA-binding beta-propeller fold protein YncE